jgi:chemotaxis protein methyltransferase CheR
MPETVRILEFELLLLAIARRYGLDLTGYARKSLMRRIQHFKEKAGLHHFSELLPRVLHDRTFFMRLLTDISVSVTELFRDPQVFFMVRRLIFPKLKAHPYLKIWHAGCATGEEVYSLAILLHECQLLERATIYATDISGSALDKARHGIYDKNELAKGLENYKKAGGIFDLKDYYIEKYEHIRFHRFLRASIAFAEHDLVSGAPFGEINLIFCRNVFIYFDRLLQNKVAQKFASSLVDGGLLVLGTSESLQFIEANRHFENLSAIHKLYRKIAAT